MNELERVRSQAVGQEVDQALLDQYPVQSQEKMEFPTPTWEGNCLCLSAFYRAGEAAGTN